MAKIEAWEQRIRDEMKMFAFQLNMAEDTALGARYMVQQADPDNVPELDHSDPKWTNCLVEPAQQHMHVAAAIKQAIQVVEEEGSGEQLYEAMKPVIRFTYGLEVTLEWSVLHYKCRLVRDLTKGNEETHPHYMVALVFWLDDYLGRYRELLHLGVCRHCHSAYLKPKHGKKQRYCSRACQQKAYRVRKAAREEQGR